MLRVEQMTMGLSREKHQKVCWDYAIEQEVLCDCFWIQEVLINLMRNAIEHTPEYGHIRIWTEETDSCVNINIQDDGPGIPREDQQQIFRRFFTDVSVENGRRWTARPEPGFNYSCITKKVFLVKQVQGLNAKRKRTNVCIWITNMI